MGCGFESCCRHSFFHSNHSFNAKFRSNSVQKSRIVQFGTLWHSKAVHGLNLQASAANLHIVKILRDIEGSFYNSYGIQGLEMTFWALYFHTPICHSALRQKNRGILSLSECKTAFFQKGLVQCASSCAAPPLPI